MSLPLAVGLVGVALAIIRLALPFSRLTLPRRAADALLVFALVLIAVALIGAMWPMGTAYRLQWVSVADGHSAADMTWPVAFMCAGVAYGTLRAAAKLMTWADPEVRILSPLGGHVDWKHDLYGAVFPPDAPVQVFVFSRDKRWYPKKAEVSGSAWRIPQCQIGNEAVPPDGFKYQLVAISEADEITTARTSLPQGAARSRVVRVSRQV